MSVSFAESQTKINLLRAFAGESQARNRYTFSAGLAKKQGLPCIEMIFLFTANQELAHARAFYDYLEKCSGENIAIDGSYPIDLYSTVAEHLRAAQHNEMQEYEHDYTGFAHTAKEEGFPEISHLFSQIARIEKVHGERFGQFADLLEQNKLFISDVECQWMCLNCGYIVTATRPPEMCPVCKHEQGYFVRLEMVPWQMKKEK
ncbi:MAG: rubrerythrin family protein [Oscillospiraceae bacterium]|jgi:rubrerythrin|nr:rubrerythrin family protein [Oscillospiraceae bacterium]